MSDIPILVSLQTGRDAAQPPPLIPLPSQTQGVERYEIPIGEGNPILKDRAQIRSAIKNIDDREGDFKQSLTVYPELNSPARIVHHTVSPDREDNM